MLALSNLPTETIASDFPTWTQKVVGYMDATGDLSCMFIVAASISNAKSEPAYRVIEKFVRDSDTLIASACAIAGGAVVSAKDLTGILSDTTISQSVRAHFLLGASNRKDRRFSELAFLLNIWRVRAFEIRKLAAISLGFQGDPNAIPDLRKLAQDASYDVRACGVIAAALIDSPIFLRCL